VADFRAYRIHEREGGVQAGFEWLTLGDLTPGGVVIRTQYSSINYKDALAATGRGRVLRRFPLVGGIDVAGIVESSTDARIAVGTAVLVTGCGLGEDHDGGYAGRVRVPADWVVPLPDGLTPFEAMAIGTAGFTAALALDRMEQNGQRPENGPLLVTGATGGARYGNAATGKGAVGRSGRQCRRRHAGLADAQRQALGQHRQYRSCRWQ
jgi:NADPH2:quinone reductase